MSDLLEKCKFQPKLNNGHLDGRNSSNKGKKRKKERGPSTSWFGYYPDDVFSSVLLPQQVLHLLSVLTVIVKLIILAHTRIHINTRGHASTYTVSQYVWLRRQI
ncbi:hypothetical protein DsansV1_C14g0129031 [Dioscorea sansibarensis]